MSFSGSGVLPNISESGMVGSFRSDLIQDFISLFNFGFGEGDVIKIPSKLLYLGLNSQRGVGKQHVILQLHVTGW